MEQKNETISTMTFIDQTLEVMADCDASLKEINSLMEKEFLEIRKKYASSLNILQEKKEEAFQKLESFALLNQEVLFSIKRSIKTKFGTFGFRTGKQRFALISGNTWLSVTNLLKEILPAYVRYVAEPAKDKLLADRELPDVARRIPALGLNVVQDETFFIDLKKE